MIKLLAARWSFSLESIKMINALAHTLFLWSNYKRDSCTLFIKIRGFYRKVTFLMQLLLEKKYPGFTGVIKNNGHFIDKKTAASS